MTIGSMPLYQHLKHESDSGKKVGGSMAPPAPLVSPALENVRARKTYKRQC